MTPEEDAAALLGAEDAAARAGVKRGTWTSYVARGRAPRPDDRDRRTGSPLWLESTVDAWKRDRPGRGAGGGRPRKEA